MRSANLTRQMPEDPSADASVISPMRQRSPGRRAACAPLAGAEDAVKPASTAPAAATPMLMASICTMDSRLLPLLAMLPSRSRRVTVFIAVNCSELTAPKQASCRMCSHSGWAGVTRRSWPWSAHQRGVGHQHRR
jgi:hypothetical protein